LYIQTQGNQIADKYLDIQKEWVSTLLWKLSPYIFSKVTCVFQDALFKDRVPLILTSTYRTDNVAI